MSHLTSDQIVAYRDGEFVDAVAREHLVSCAVCQARVTDAQHLAALLQPPSPESPIKHPTARTLAAYYDGVLSPWRRAPVERHLKQCERCNAELVILSKAMEDL